MIKFCRHCGKEFIETADKTCSSCGANAVKATAYCRYCGHSTSVEDGTCLHCGASIKPLPGSVRTLFEHPRLSAKMGKVVNLSIVAVLVALYVVFSLPKAVTKPIKAAASDVVLSTTGYSALPLSSLSTWPMTIPPLRSVENFYIPVGVNVNSTQQLTVYAVFKSSGTNNATKATHMEVVTDKAVFQSSNDKVATVNASGFVHAVALGAATISVSYTAVPGSANMSAAAEGKKPITVTTTVPILVTGDAPAQSVVPAPGT